jgi:ATP-binding cassette, subfamily B, bacterial
MERPKKRCKVPTPTGGSQDQKGGRRLRPEATTPMGYGSMRTLVRIGRELGWRGRVNAGLVILVLGVQATTGAVPALVLRQLLDAVPRHDASLVYRTAGTLAGLAIVFSLLSLCHRALAARVGYGLLHRLQVKLYHQLERLPLSFFTQTPAGELQSALTENFTVLRGKAVQDLAAAVNQVFSLLGAAVVLYLLDPSLALIGYALMPAIVIWSELMARRTARADKQERDASSHLLSLSREAMSVDGVVATKTLRGRTLSRQFSEVAKSIASLRARLDVSVRWALVPVELSAVLLTTGTFAYIALRAIAGKPTLSVGTLVVFANALAVFLYGLKNVIERQLDLTGILGRFAEIFALLDTDAEIEPGTRELPHPATGALEFHHVSFRYAPDGPWVLRDVTIRVPAGECVAVVGATGAGKTTLGLLAVRLYDTIQGQVTLDGIDIKQLTLESLRRVGYVPQKPFLFHDTIWANICLGSPDATHEAVASAARKAQIHDWITGLQDGYDTIVGTDGYRLSGGQAQRIIIARTLLSNPPLLVLDEATSALDNTTQLEIERALRHLGGRTTLLVAHRLSTVKGADHIVVLDGGRVAESGTHDQLLRQNGKYAELVRAEHP